MGIPASYELDVGMGCLTDCTANDLIVLIFGQCNLVFRSPQHTSCAVLHIQRAPCNSITPSLCFPNKELADSAMLTRTPLSSDT